MKTCTFCLLAVLALAACDTVSDTNGATGTPPIRIQGNWTYSFDVVDETGEATCQTRGSIAINQTQAGDQFGGLISGVYSCTYGGDTNDQTAVLPISAGELSGLSVRFIAFGCTHLGAASGDPATSMSGGLTCTFPLTPGGPTRVFSGSWGANR